MSLTRNPRPAPDGPRPFWGMAYSRRGGLSCGLVLGIPEFLVQTPKTFFFILTTWKIKVPLGGVLGLLLQYETP